ncbi:MAG: hypothetical protein HY875_15100 [Chloroflexi bacterium]|nr:hypothetical protein [Chloroflexota bacterium]
MSEQRQGPVRYGKPDFEYISRMAATPPESDGPIYMVNLMKYRAVADYADSGAPVRSGREADDLYAPTGILRDIGAEVVFVADVERQLLGAAPAWDRIGIVKYPTRRSFLAMQRRPDFQEKHVHKDAGMEQTIVMACTPLPLPRLPEPAPVELADGDRPFVMLHVLKFAEGGVDGMNVYGASAGAAGFELGVRPEAYFAVEGTVLGDGRGWDQVRFNRFPSHAAFEKLRQVPAHQQAQATRQQALADTYAMMLLPTVDRLAAAFPA